MCVSVSWIVVSFLIGAIVGGAVVFWNRRRSAQQPLGLDEFVTKSLSGIAKGLREVNRELIEDPNVKLKENTFFLEPSVKSASGREPVIEFDVAVTSKAVGGGKVGVASVLIEGSGSFAHSRESVSRIKFVVHNKNYLG